MAGLPDADKLLEVARDELAAPIGDDPRSRIGVSFACPLQDNFRVGFLHGGADIPRNYVTRTAIQHAAKIATENWSASMARLNSRPSGPRHPFAWRMLYG